ncbi:MAG: TonB-dependent receptor [Paludibacter sp.]|nr:TonB-dependent receptor [Paludibacter sp.]
MSLQLAFAQGTIKGIVVDKATNEALIGVSVYNPTSGVGVSTSLDGTFSIKLPEGKQDLTVSYIGYTTQTIQVNLKSKDQVTISLENEAIGLNDLTVTSSVAIRRKTPVALSVIEPAQIEMKLGTQEFPEILKSTPGIYATKMGGGYGDSRVNLRGFSSENIAVMINGVPMNDMEWGGVYWSNWAGLSDVTRSMQVQRGLGASKIAAPTVGGSINIVTRSTEARKGGSIYYGMGHNGQEKMSFTVSSGLNKGWAMTLLGARNTGNGYIQGTEYEGYSYFLNVSKIFNDQHQLSFTGFGAPQWHNQRRDQLLISEWAKYGLKYNSGLGFDVNGKRKTFNYNYYHKPQLSLNHFWTINQKSSLSTALYMSIGQGGGYGSVGVNRNDAFGSTGGIVNTKYRKVDGTLDIAKMQTDNAASETGSLLATQESINNHIWNGLLSTYQTTLFNKFDFQAGVDLRFYKGIHQSKVADLLGGKFVIDPARATGKFKTDPVWVNERLTVGDISFRDWDGFVAQEGVFGQVEYNEGKLSSFVAGAVNNSTYWRVDRFYVDNIASEIINKLGYSIKGGANYNLDYQQNIFANIGYFSRTPFFSNGIFLQTTTSNATNKQANNEKVFSAEIGYGFRSKYFSANVNIYNTKWMDKTMIRAIDSTDPDRGTVNMAGVDALHQGFEMDFTSKPIKNLEINGMISLGNWKWINNATGYLYNRDGQPINTVEDVVDLLGPTHAFITLNLDGIRVGNSAQTTANISTSYEFMKGLKAGLDYTYYGRNFANFNILINNWGVNKFIQPWQIPSSGSMDFFVNYRFNMGEYKASLFGNINNILDNIYITDAQNGADGTWQTAQVYYGFGRTWSMGLKVSF